MPRTSLLFILILGLALTSAKNRSKSKTYGTKHAVNDIDISGENGQIALSSLANEFVHSLHESIYLVNQAVQNAQDAPVFQKSLIQISNDATDLAFAVQKEIHGDHRQLEFQIKSSVIFLGVLLPEVTKIAETNENLTYSCNLLREAIDSTLFAVQKLEARSDLNKKTNAEVADEALKAFEMLFVALNETVKSDDKGVFEELHIQCHHLNHILDQTVNKIEVWLHANTVENQNSKIVEGVAQSLGDITADLRKSISTKLTLQQLKEKFETTIRAAAAEIKNLGQVEVNADQANQDHAKGMYRDLLFDAVAIGRTFATKFDLISKTSSE